MFFVFFTILNGRRILVVGRLDFQLSEKKAVRFVEKTLLNEATL